MCGINLDFVAPFCTHLAQRHLGVLEQHLIFDGPKADRDTRGVGHGMCADLEDIGWVDTGGSAEDELERVLCIQLEAGYFGGGVREGRGYSCDALAVTVQVEGAKLSGCELKARPLERDGGLRYVA